MATRKLGYGAPPIKPAMRGRKYQIGVLVSGPTKNAIVASARVSGRSLSREAEHLIERCLAFDAALVGIGRAQETAAYKAGVFAGQAEALEFVLRSAAKEKRTR